MNATQRARLYTFARAIEESTHIHVKLTIDEAKEVTKLLEEYNNWTPEAQVELIEKLGKFVPPMDFGPNNPNTGHPHHEFIIGREGSRVLYLVINKVYMPKDFDYDYLLKTCDTFGRAVQADERGAYPEGVGYPGGGSHSWCYRWWWD